jgi:hypothetical protein
MDSVRTVSLVRLSAAVVVTVSDSGLVSHSLERL